MREQRRDGTGPTQPAEGAGPRCRRTRTDRCVTGLIRRVPAQDLAGQRAPIRLRHPERDGRRERLDPERERDQHRAREARAPAS